MPTNKVGNRGEGGSLMKNPLHYQLTEYDCGPTSMLNAVSFLFDREEIPPEIIRETMLYCMDCHGADGLCGKMGTSCTAMMFLANWYNNFGHMGQLPIACDYLRGEDVYFGEGSEVSNALEHGSVAVVRLSLEDDHYVLLTGIDRDQEKVYMFDPYYVTEPFEEKDIEFVSDHPFSCNRIVPIKYLNREEGRIYSLGPAHFREAVILTNVRKVMAGEQEPEELRFEKAAMEENSRKCTKDRYAAGRRGGNKND